jgi:hypothetical protein
LSWTVAELFLLLGKIAFEPPAVLLRWHKQRLLSFDLNNIIVVVVLSQPFTHIFEASVIVLAIGAGKLRCS